MLKNLTISILNRFKGDGLEARVLQDTGSSLIVKISGMGVSFLLQLLLARVLGVEEYGNYIYVITWMIILSLFGTLGFGQAAIRYIADYKSAEDWGLLNGYVRRASQLVISLSIFSTLIVALVLSQLSAAGFVEPVLSISFWFASPLLLLLAMFDLQTGILRGSDRLVHALTLQLIVYPLGIAVATIGAILVSSNSVTASIAIQIHIVVLLVIIILQRYYIRQSLPARSAGIMPRYLNREWLSTSTSMWTSQAIQTLLRRLDVLAVGTLVGTREAGIYAIASRLVQLLDLGLQVTNLASAHRFAPLHSQGKKKELQRIVFLTTKISFLSTFPIALILFLAADQVLYLFGEDFVGGMPILKILIFGEMVNVVTGPNAWLLNMTGHHKDMAWIYFYSLILDVCMILLLFNPLGVLGIAIASSTSIAFRNILSVQRVWQSLGINSTIFSPKAWVPNRQ